MMGSSRAPVESGCEQTDDLDHEQAFLVQTTNGQSMDASTEFDLRNSESADIAICAEMLRCQPNASIRILPIAHNRLMTRTVDNICETLTKRLLLGSEKRLGEQMSAADWAA